MKTTTLVRTLCVPYCAYFKQDRNEELLCRGAVVVERLTATRAFIPGSEFVHGEPEPETQETLIRRVCTACDFRESDCDFAQDRRARPCGGFILLGSLLGSGTITADDL